MHEDDYDTKRLERLLERYGNGELDRRSFLGLTAAAAATAGVSTRWTGRALAAVTEVRFDGWGGVVQEAIDKIRLPALHREDRHQGRRRHVRRRERNPDQGQDRASPATTRSSIRSGVE